MSRPKRKYLFFCPKQLQRMLDTMTVGGRSVCRRKTSSTNPKTQMKYPTPRTRQIFLAIWNDQKRIITRQQSPDAAIAFLEACK